MAGLHLAVSFGFGAIGLIVAVGGLRMWNAEKDMRNKRKQIQSRIDKDDIKRAEQVAELQKILDEAIVTPHPPDGYLALLAAQKNLETAFYGWLSRQNGLFFVVWDERPQIVKIADGAFKYELPEGIRKFAKRNKK